MYCRVIDVLICWRHVRPELGEPLLPFYCSKEILHCIEYNISKRLSELYHIIVPKILLPSQLAPFPTLAATYTNEENIS